MNPSDLIWQPAIVVEYDHKPWLEFPALSSCARCRTGNGCGAGVFALFFAGRRARLAMPQSTHWQPGERVRVGVSARQLVRASLALYLFPLLCFMLGIVMTGLVLSPDAEGWSLLMGIVFTVAGLTFIRSRALRVQSLMLEPLSEHDPLDNCDSQAVS